MRNLLPGGSFEDYSAQNISTAERRKRKLFLLFKIKSPQYTFFTPPDSSGEAPGCSGSAAVPVHQSVYNPCLCLCTCLSPIVVHCTIHVFVFIGPWFVPCLVDLTDVTLAFEDFNSKLFDIVSAADDVDTEERVDYMCPREQDPLRQPRWHQFPSALAASASCGTSFGLL